MLKNNLVFLYYSADESKYYFYEPDKANVIALELTEILKYKLVGYDFDGISSDFKQYLSVAWLYDKRTTRGIFINGSDNNVKYVYIDNDGYLKSNIITNASFLGSLFSGFKFDVNYKLATYSYNPFKLYCVKLSSTDIKCFDAIKNDESYLCFRLAYNNLNSVHDVIVGEGTGLSLTVYFNEKKEYLNSNCSLIFMRK